MAKHFVKYNNEIYTGDFNGDGKTDFVATPKSGTYAGKWGLFLSNDAGTQCNYVSNGTLMDGFEKIYTGDFNGDGKTDIIQRRKYNSNYTNYFVYYSTGSGFTYGGTAFYTVNNRSSELLVGEFNGDGVSDVIIYYPGAKDFETFISSYSNGVVVPLEKKSTRYVSENWEQVELGDFNGDGLTDICHVKGNEIILSDGYGTLSGRINGVPLNQSRCKFGDFNGDGKTDILIQLYDIDWDGGSPGQPPSPRYTPSRWKLNYSTGIGFESVYLDMRFVIDRRSVFVGDLNGDGKDDLITVDKTNAQGNSAPMQLYIKTSDTDFAYQQGINVYPADTWSFYQGDFNGDGRVDFLGKSNSYEIYNGDTIYGFSGYQLCNSITDRDRLLKKATDSYGNTTEFSYKPLTNKDVYTAQTNGSYPVSDFTAPLLVVEKMTQPDGIGGTRATNYKYAGAKLHKRGKGLLGFSKFTATDEKTGISSVSIYEYDPTRYVMGLKRTETRISKGGYSNLLLSEVNYVNTYREYNGYYTAPIYTYQPTSIEEKNYELDSTSPYKTTTTSYTYDDYGNVLTTEQSFGTEATIRSVNQYSTVNPAQWHLGRLEKATVTKQTTGQPDIIVRTSEFEYNPASGLLTKEIMEPNNDLLGFSKTYEHDSFGNVTKTTVTTNENSVTDRVVYDSRGRFMIESYNALDQKTTKQTHPIYGTLTSVTDINELTATKTYDAFGREKLTTGPDGSKAVTALRWCRNVDNAPSNALWFKYVEASGSPGAMVFYDKMKREVRTATVGFDGKMIFTDTEYNALGQVSRQSDPYFKDEAPVWSELTYDVLGRMTQKKLPDASLIKVTYSGLTVTTENALGQKNIKRTNMQGLLVESKDNAQKSVTYKYNSAGKPVEVRNSKGSVITMEYDLVGNRTKLVDPELGTIVSRFNAFGELVYEKDANNNESTFEYDALGRITTRTEKEGTTTWTYDTEKNGKGKIASLSAPDGYTQGFKYDKLGRVIEAKEKIAGTEYVTSTVYDSYGRVLKVNYPSVRDEKFTVWNKYNANGYLAEVINNETGKVYWTAGAINARGQLTRSVYGNGLTSVRTYNPLTGTLSRIKTDKQNLTVQDWSYVFDPIGNLTERKDLARGLTESFEYDNLNRLRYVKKNTVQTLEMTYDELGNILTKSDVGTYNYDDASHPYRLTSITPNAGSRMRNFDQRAAYTSFDKVRSLAQNADSLHLHYNASYDRMYADSYHAGSLKKRRTYIGKLYEQEKDFTIGNIKETFYIFGGDGLITVG